MLHPSNPPQIPLGTLAEETNLRNRIKIIPFSNEFIDPVDRDTEIEVSDEAVMLNAKPVDLNVFECIPCGNTALLRISIEEYADKLLRHLGNNQSVATDKWIQVEGPITGPLNGGTTIYIEPNGKLTYKYGQTGKETDGKYRDCITRQYAIKETAIHVVVPTEKCMTGNNVTYDRDGTEGDDMPELVPIHKHHEYKSQSTNSNVIVSKDKWQDYYPYLIASLGLIDKDDIAKISNINERTGSGGFVFYVSRNKPERNTRIELTYDVGIKAIAITYKTTTLNITSLC